MGERFESVDSSGGNRDVVPRAVHTARRARAGPKDSSTSPQAAARLDRATSPSRSRQVRTLSGQSQSLGRRDLLQEPTQRSHRSVRFGQLCRVPVHIRSAATKQASLGAHWPKRASSGPPRQLTWQLRSDGGVAASETPVGSNGARQGRLIESAMRVLSAHTAKNMQR